MLEKLVKVKERYDELSKMIADPQVIADTKEWQKLCKEQNSLQEIVDAYNKYVEIEKQISEAEGLLKIESDQELRSMLSDEIFENKKKIEKLNDEVKILLLPKDENDEGNVIMEIRGGAGGEEASLFAGDLYRMYTMYANLKGYRIEVIDSNETELGGIKEIVFMVNGAGAFKNLKFESGVHRVQRVPETESSGRVHTSTATVAVLPEAPDVNVEINEKDLRIDNYCSSGAGGQHVNKTESAIRITHLPTGIVVTCQDERSKIKNLDKAMKVLKAKLYDMEKQKAEKEYAENRHSQVGTGDRSERIRTYNFPQGRVTDHRIGLTLYNLTDFMNGHIDEVVEALQLDHQQKLLAQAVEE